MSTSVKYLAIAALALSSAIAAQPLRPAAASDESARSFYTPGGQYTATFDQTHNYWWLHPSNGQDVVIDTVTCATGAMVPAGYWIIEVDEKGRPELVAPSITPLPAGSPDRIELRSCDTAQGRQLAVPQTVLDLLVTNTGAVNVIN